MCTPDAVSKMQQSMGISSGNTPALAPPPQVTPQVAPADPRDFSNKYNTQLSPKEELMFQAWAAKNGKTKDTYDYDLRGAWKEIQSGNMKAADNGHLGDKYKKPNHPTFSDQSVYSGKDGYVGGKWGNEGGKDTFTPGKGNMYQPQELQRYFQKVEPNAKLYAPGIAQ